MKLRKFNNAGIALFRNYVETLRENKKHAPPLELLQDNGLSEIIPGNRNTVDCTFSNRLCAAKYLDSLLSGMDFNSVMPDTGLWAWLALRHFEELRPLDCRYFKNMGIDAPRFIPAPLDDHRQYYRHLLRHPYQIYHHCNRNMDAALCFLVQPVYKPGDFIEQLASRRRILQNIDMMKAITALFVNKKENQIKSKAPSMATEFQRVVLGQFDCTWDLGYVRQEKLLSILPKQFKQFLETSK